jgi:MFS superfamily sulfate permease-like transporter
MNIVKIFFEEEKSMLKEVEFDEENVPYGKIFTDKKLWLGSMLGGPLVAGYIIYKNYHIFNEFNKAKKVMLITILFSIILITIIFLIPDSIRIPDQLMPFIYTCIAWGFMKKSQGNKIEEHIKNGGQLIGWGKTLLISLLGFIITVAIFLILILIIYMAQRHITRLQKNCF